jgi:drug/metabolite transporter (DMT)-like permease
MGPAAEKIGNDARGQGATTVARLGVLAAILSSSVGGMNTAVTRYAIGATDPITLAALRFGLGFILLLPIALACRSRWPQRRDWIAVACLGILFFGVFMALFNLALRYTTAARGALALSTLPLLTMVAGAALRIEPLTRRKTSGVLAAMAGVALALATGLADAPAGAWRGDAVMVVAALCYALYNVWSRPFIARSDSLAFVTVGMGAGSGCLALLAWSSGGFATTARFGAGQWTAVAYLVVIGAALTFFLWVFALARTTPTRVANAITLNPVTASIVAALLLGEPLGLNLVVGVAAVFAGIWIASTDRASGRSPLRQQERSATRLLRLLSAVGLRRNALPPDFGDRMYRDIGIAPPPKPPAGPWPWHDPRA